MQRYPIQDTKNIVDYHHYPFFHHFHFKAQAGCIRQYLWIVKLLGKAEKKKKHASRDSPSLPISFPQRRHALSPRS